MSSASFRSTTRIESCECHCSKLVDGRANEATDCAFTHESGNTMTADEYEKLPAADRERFKECPQCGAILNLEELLLHLAYKHSRSERLD
jgi:hypothetical protein